MLNISSNTTKNVSKKQQVRATHFHFVLLLQKVTQKVEFQHNKGNEKLPFPETTISFQWSLLSQEIANATSKGWLHITEDIG